MYCAVEQEESACTGRPLCGLNNSHAWGVSRSYLIKCKNAEMKYSKLRVIISLRRLQPRSGTTVLDGILIVIMLANNALHTV